MAKDIKIRKIPLFIRVVSFYIIVILLFWGGNQAYSIVFPQSKVILVANSESVLSNSVETSVNTRISGKPLRISVERLGIDLAVNDGVYDYSKNDWTLSKDAAQYALVTQLPNNQSGNTLIYGHNTRAVFAPLKNISVGDIVSITTTNGHTFRYAYSHDSIVPPDFTQVLNDNPDTPRLTILTCEGTLSQARRLMYFDLKDVI